MKSGLRAYFDLIYRDMDCYATWLPGTPVAVGEIGKISRQGSFLHTGELRSRASLPPTRKQKVPPQTVSTTGGVTFSAGTDVQTHEAVQALATADAKLDITFRGVEAAALLLQDISLTEFVDEQPVRDLMRSMLAAGTLQPDEIVVTYVLEARSGVVATTYDAQKGTDIEVNAAVGKGAIQVANVGGHLKVVCATRFPNYRLGSRRKTPTPVYRALAFRSNRNWWSFWRRALELESVIPTQSFADQDREPTDILAGRPSLAVPEGDDD